MVQKSEMGQDIDWVDGGSIIVAAGWVRVLGTRLLSSAVYNVLCGRASQFDLDTSFKTSINT